MAARKSSRYQGSIVVIAILILAFIGALAIVVKPWKYFHKLPIISSLVPVVAEAPASDGARAMQVQLDPVKKATLVVKDTSGVIISLDIPKGSVSHKEFISISPIIEAKGSIAVVTGFSILPKSLRLAQPITAFIDLGSSSIRADAPATALGAQPRITGKAHVYKVDEEAKMYVPALVQRAIETSTILPVRLISGGVYVVSVDGGRATDIAKTTLRDKKAGVLATLESALTLLGNGQTLTKEEKEYTKKAVDSVLGKKQLVIPELMAAVSIRKRLEGQKTSLVSRVYAQDAFRELLDDIRKTCSESTHSVEDYVASAAIARLLGADDLAVTCDQMARATLEREVSATENNAAISYQEVLQMLVRVRIIAGDSSPFIARLEKKLKDVLERDMRSFLNKGNANVEDITSIEQEMELAPVDSELKGQVQTKIKEDIAKLIERLLAQACPSKEQLTFLKTFANAHNVNQLDGKIDQKTKDVDLTCDKLPGAPPPGSPPLPPPPPPPPGAPTPKPTPVECKYVHTFSCSYGTDHSIEGDCQICWTIGQHDPTEHCALGNYEYAMGLWDKFDAECPQEVPPVGYDPNWNEPSIDDFPQPAPPPDLPEPEGGWDDSGSGDDQSPPPPPPDDDTWEEFQ